MDSKTLIDAAAASTFAAIDKAVNDAEVAKAAAEASLASANRKLAAALEAGQASADEVLELQTSVAAAQAENKILQQEIDALKAGGTPTTPSDLTRVQIGAAYYSNLSKSDGVAEAAATPYDVVRIYGGGGDTTATRKGYVVKAAKTGAKHLILSFKVPKSWLLMKSEAAWFAQCAKDVSEQAVASGITVWLMFHHEPENDTGTNAGNTAAGRDAWNAMQVTAGGAIKGKFKNVRFGVCLMGYHSVKSGQGLYSLWQLEKCIPVASVEFVFFDLYQWYGTFDSAGKQKTAWSDLRTQMKVLADFCNPKGLVHGEAEWGLVQVAGNTAKGKTFHADMAQWSRELGAMFLCYFNTDAKSTTNPDFTKKFAMEPSGPRWSAWVNVLKGKTKYTLTA